MLRLQELDTRYEVFKKLDYICHQPLQLSDSKKNVILLSHMTTANTQTKKCEVCHLWKDKFFKKKL